MHSIVATPSMLDSIKPMRNHPIANWLHGAIALQFCGHMCHRELHNQRSKNLCTLLVGVGGVA